jgi:glycerophosphoryl diester phosphodiesterase
LLIEDYDKKPLEEQLEQLGFIPSIYSPAHQLVTPALVQQCRERKMGLIPWTVNDLARMQRLKDMGVDGIISDYPSLFADLK